MPPRLGFRLLYHAYRVRFPANICAYRNHSRGQSSEHFQRLGIRVQVGNRQAGAFAGERCGDGESYASGAACDQRTIACESCIQNPPSPAKSRFTLWLND